MKKNKGAVAPDSDEAIAGRLLDWVARRRGAVGLVAALCDPKACIAANNSRRIALWLGFASKVSSLTLADHLRSGAIAKLRECGDPKVVDALIEALSHKNSFVRIHASELLSHFDDARGIPVLVVLLDNIDGRVRRRAALALAAVQNTVLRFEMSVRIAEALRNRGALERIALIELLSESWCFLDSDVIRALADSLNDTNWRTRTLVAETLSRMNWLPSTPDERVPYALARNDMPAIVALGEVAAAVLVEQWRIGPDWETERHIDKALIQIGVNAVPQLIGALSLEAGVRQKAINRLGDIGDSRAVRPLCEALAAPESDIQWAAMIALAKIDDQRVFGILCGGLSHPNRGVRQVAAAALGKSGNPAAIQPLIEALHKEEMLGKAHVVKALSAIGDPRVVDALIVLLERRDRAKDADSDQRDWIVQIGIALAKFDTPSAREFLNKAISMSERLIVVGAASYFIAHCQPGWESIIVESLHDYSQRTLSDDVRSGVVAALRTSSNAQLRTAGERFHIDWHTDTAMVDDWALARHERDRLNLMKRLNEASNTSGPKSPT